MKILVDAEKIRNKDESGVIVFFNKGDILGIRRALKAGASNMDITFAMIYLMKASRGYGITLKPSKTLSKDEAESTLLEYSPSIYLILKDLVYDKIKRVREEDERENQKKIET